MKISQKIAYSLLFQLLSICFATKATAQLGIDMPFWFKTGLRVQTSYTPIQNDSTLDLRMAHYQVQGIFSIKSKLSANLNADIKLKDIGKKGSFKNIFKKSDIGFKQSFIAFNAGMRVVEGNIFSDKNTHYWANANISYTNIKASLRGGVWVRTLQVGAVQDVDNLQDTRPFALAAVAKIFVKGLRKQNIFGLGIAYTPNGKILPIPIIGFNRRLAKKWDINVLIPANIAVLYQANKNLLYRLRINANSLQTGVTRLLPITQNAQLRTPNRLDYTQLETNLSVQYKFTKNLLLLVQGAYLIGTNLNFSHDNHFLYDAKLSKGFFYGSMGLHFNLKDGLFGSQTFMVD